MTNIILGLVVGGFLLMTVLGGIAWVIDLARDRG